jgi:hypothetical protein
LASKNWNVAIIGFPLIQAKRMGMVLAEKIKNHPNFFFQAEWADAPCDAVIVDTGEVEARATAVSQAMARRSNDLGVRLRHRWRVKL